MTVHRFGASSSHLCANYDLHKCAKLFGPGYDQAVPEATRTGFHVDDYLTFLATDVEVINFLGEFSILLAQERFRRRKWASNSQNSIETFVNLRANHLCD